MPTTLGSQLRDRWHRRGLRRLACPSHPSGGPRSRHCWPGSGRRLSCWAPAGCTRVSVSLAPRRGPHCRASSPHSPSHWGQDCSLWRWGHDLVHTQHVPTVSSAPSSHPWALPWSLVAEWTPAGGPSLSGLSGPRGWQAGSLWTSRVTSLARHLLALRSLPASPRAPWASPALHSRNPPPVVVRKRTLLGQMDKHTGQRLLSSRPQALKSAPEGMWRGPIWAPTPTNNFIMGLEATSL